MSLALKPTAQLACPGCSKTLMTKPYAGVAFLLQCDDCRAAWLEKGQLALMTFASEDMPSLERMRNLAWAGKGACPVCRGTQLVCLPHTVESGVPVEWCQQCEGKWLLLESLDKIRRISTGVAEEEPLEVIASRGKLKREGWIRFLAIPVGVGLVPLIRAVPPLAAAFDAASRAVHEVGHWLVAWLAARVAVPLIPVQLPSGERSLSAYLAVIALLGFLSWRSLKARKRFPAAVCAALFLMQNFLTFFQNDSQVTTWVAFGGLAAELILSLLLVIAFYHEFPESWRWRYWRYASLLIGMYCFARGYTFWDDLAVRQEALPVGAALQSASESLGDVNRLVNELGWSLSRLSSVFLASARVVTAIICLQYLAFATKLARAPKP